MITSTARALGVAMIGGALALSTLAPAQAVEPSTDVVGGALLGGSGVQVRPVDGADVAALPATRAKSWVLADAGTGEVLAAKNAHARRLPASTLKMLTAVTLLPRLDPTKKYRATWDDANIEGSKVGIVAGGTYTVDDLFNALFLASGNDAAGALANANGGMRRTVAQMNEEAARLGAHDTVARNTSGLDAKGQRSSAYDLALITRAGLSIPEFREYATLRRTSFPGGPTKRKKKRSSFEVYNRNPLITKGYKGALGIKTGYTQAARRTFIGAAERDGRTLIVTAMGYEGDTYELASQLLTWGFRATGDVEPVGHLVDPGSGGDEGGSAEDAEDAQDAVAAVAVDPDIDAAGGWPSWPFIALGAPLALLAAAAMRGVARPARTPLEAANRNRRSARSRRY